MLASTGSFFYYFVNRIIVESDEKNLLWDFFQNEGGFVFGLLIALAVALIMAATYYFVCGNLSYRLSNIYVWLIVALLAGGVSYYSTRTYAKLKLQKNLETVVIDLYDNVDQSQTEEDMDEAHREIDEFQTNWEEALNKPHVAIVNFGVTNTVYALLFFFIFSILIKNFTIHLKSVPFGKARKSR